MEKVAVQAFCQNCHMKCRVFLTLRNGQIQSIDNAMEIKGVKRTQGHEEIYHRDRLIYPQRRVGKRGEGKWQRISLGEALEPWQRCLAKSKRDMEWRRLPQSVAEVTRMLPVRLLRFLLMS